MPKNNSPFMWQEIVYPRPLDDTTAVEMLRRLADEPEATQLVLELRATAKRTHFLLGCHRDDMHRLIRTIGVTATTAPLPDRVAIMAAKIVRPSNQIRAFALDDLSLSSGAILEALHRVNNSEVLVLQLVLGRRLTAFSTPQRIEAPRNMLQLLWGTPARSRTSDDVKALRLKNSLPGFKAIVRIGVSAKLPARRQTLLLGLFGALKRLEQPGVRLNLSNEDPRRFDAPFQLGWRAPYRLSIREAAAFISPVGTGELAGLAPLHPVQLAPLRPLPRLSKSRIALGTPTAAGVAGLLSLSIEALLRGLYIAGPPGVGKSTLQATIAIALFNAGYGGAVIEPKGDTANDVVRRINPSERHRIVYADLTDPSSTFAFNPFDAAHAKPNRPARPKELVADGILQIFRQIFGEGTMGIRTADVVHASLLTLLHDPNATLDMLPLLLTDDTFRRQKGSSPVEWCNC